MAHEFDRKKLEKDLDDLEKLITHRGMSARGALATLSMQFIAGAYDVAPSERAQGVLAPRFTRDEAIAIVKAAIPLSPWADVTGPSIEMVRGIRLALEALAAACVFSDECRDGPCRACAREMSDKLDAAGIK